MTELDFCFTEKQNPILSKHILVLYVLLQSFSPNKFSTSTREKKHILFLLLNNGSCRKLCLKKGEKIGWRGKNIKTDLLVKFWRICQSFQPKSFEILIMICNQKLVSQIMFRNLFYWSHQNKKKLIQKNGRNQKYVYYYTSTISLSLQSFVSVLCCEFSVLNLIGEN